MIECDKFYTGTVAGARWYPNEEDPNAPTLCLRIEVGEDSVLHYLNTKKDDDLPKLVRQLKAIGVQESEIHTAAFLDDPASIIGNPRCRFKTKSKPTSSGKVSVGFLCDETQREVAPMDAGARAGILARLKKATGATEVNDHGAAVDDEDVPF